MPYCENCGQKISADDTFCTGCGTDLTVQSGAQGEPDTTERGHGPRSEPNDSSRTRGDHRRNQRDRPRNRQAESGAVAGGPARRQTDHRGSGEPRNRGRRRRSRDTSRESQPEPQEPRTNLSAYTLGQKIVVGGAAIAVVGAFLPWFTVEALGTTASVNGIERDGIFTFLFALAAVGLILYKGPGRWGKGGLAGCLVLGFLIALFGSAYIYDPWLGAEQPTEAEQALVNIGSGLYLTAFSGYAILGGVVYDLFVD